MLQVHDEHLPSISLEKKNELEILMKKQEKARLIRKPNPVYYAPHSYKEDDTLVESSI